MKIFKQTKIFILSPSTFTSGGPELLHQLCNTLNNNNFNAYIHYFDVDNPSLDNVPLEYRKYNLKLLPIEDKDENVLIVPESYPRQIFNYNKIRIVFWWLSVDNYLETMKNLTINYFNQIGVLKKYLIKHSLMKPLHVRIEHKLFSCSIIHITQSWYAKEFLLKKGIKSVMISDYINDDFINNSLNPFDKKNFILYNPAKGLATIQKYFDENINAIWIPLAHMNRKNMSKLFALSKIYIDFGHHPGKDRLPREAALHGCIVITNKRGSAFYMEDVYIPESFKVENEKNISDVSELINNCIDNYDNLSSQFNEYRNLIMQEKEIFRKQILLFFKRV
jgi:hypothetical protein